ncbi:MAG: DUF2079 domain-containing protein [Streptosporangiaceae bacterium]
MSHASLDRRVAGRLARHARVPPQATVSLIPVGPPAGKAMRRFRRIGYAVLALQLVGFCAWSELLYSRFAVTFDFAVYHQAWYLIAHGNLDPYSSISRLPFVRNDAEVAIWPLAPFYWIWPHDVVLLWLQDIGIVVAEAVAFTWACELAQRHCPGRRAVWLAAAGLILLVANPWTWWGISFDFHEEALAIPFAVLLARDLANGRRRAWAWVAPILAAGAPTTTYVIGIGLGAALASRRSRWPGIALMLVAFAYSGLIVALHADVGAPLTRHYGYLATASMAAYAGTKLTTGAMVKGIISHPVNVLTTLWAKRVDLLANLAPAGLLGVGCIEVLPVVVVVLLANTLSFGLRFAQPLFQAVPVYVLVPAGTVAVLARLSRRRPRIATGLAVLLTAQAVGWLAVWGPDIATHWLRIPAATSSTLAEIAARIPGSAEVIASQGVVGRFSGRVAVHELAGPGTTPVTGRDTWFVITPAAGVELQSTASAVGLAGELAGKLHATLMAHGNGVWAFRFKPPPAGLRTVRIPADNAPQPAWAAPLAPGSAGRPVLRGPVRKWHLTATGRAGYVEDGLEWLVPAGSYRVSVRMSAAAPVNVEVWNNTGDQLLTRRVIATRGVRTVVLRVNAEHPFTAPLYSGWGPFLASFVPPPAGQMLEVRVWSRGHIPVNVYRATISSRL